MLYLRRFLEIFLAISVLTLSTPSLTWQDDGTNNPDASQSPDNPGDQPLDQAVSLGDFLLGETVFVQAPFEYRLLSLLMETPEKSSLVFIPQSIPSLPHFFISASGLRPRPPTRA